MENAQYVFIETRIHKLYPGICNALNIIKQFPNLCEANERIQYPVVLSALKTMVAVSNVAQHFYPHMKHIGSCTSCGLLWERIFIDGWNHNPYSGFDFCDVFSTKLEEESLSLESRVESDLSKDLDGNKLFGDYEYIGWDLQMQMKMDVEGTKVAYHEQVTVILGLLSSSGPSMVCRFLSLVSTDGHMPWISGLEEFLNYYNFTQHENKTNEPGNWARDCDDSTPLTHLVCLTTQSIEGLIAFVDGEHPLACWKNYQLVVRRRHIETGEVEYKINKLYADVYCFLENINTMQI